jgi:hypothetical protein
LDGTPITDNAGGTVTFDLHGTTYEIDLSSENAQELRQGVRGCRSRPSSRIGTSSGAAGQCDPEPTKVIKGWAAAK